MNDEHLYAQLAEELSQRGPILGLWTKAFAESHGNESQAKALYLRYRVGQLADAERQSIEITKAVEAENKRVDAERQEAERKALAKAEGITLIHIILFGLPVLFIILLVFRYFHG